MNTSVATSSPTFKNCVQFVLGTLLAFCSLYLLVPASLSRFEINFDEGGNVAKAVLISQGYALYGDIWSDQPPLYTLMLARCFAWFGVQLGTARLLSMASGAVLLTALYSLIRLRRSALTSAVGAAMLLFSSKFLLFSSAAMIGIPALMWGVVGLLLCEQYAQVPTGAPLIKKPRWVLPLAGGVCLGCGIMTKLYIVVLVPAYGVSLILGTMALHPKAQARTLLQKFATSSLLCFAGVLLAIAGISVLGTPALIGAAWDQLIHPHHSVMGYSEFAGMKRSFSLAVLKEQWYVAAGLVSLPYLLWNKQWHLCIPFAWAVSVACLFYHHFPIWEHYYPLLAAPLAWITAEGLAVALQRSTNEHPPGNKFSIQYVAQEALRYGTICIALLALRSLPQRAKTTHTTLPSQTQGPIDGALLSTLRALPERSLLTDAPLYAILSNKAINPDFAVTSQKRLHAIDHQEQLSLENRIRTEQPELILIKRFPGLLDSVSKEIWADYRIAYQKGKTKFFVKSTVPRVTQQ